jgi:hypothetical protein
LSFSLGMKLPSHSESSLRSAYFSAQNRVLLRQILRHRQALE